MLGLKEVIKLGAISTTAVIPVEDDDEFEIPKLVLRKTPDKDEMRRREKISALRKQYGIRFEDADMVI